MAKIDAARTSIEVINAGHCPSLLFKNNELVHQWHASGPPLGIFGDSHYQSERVPLAEIDTLLLVSDGVYEWFEEDNVWGWPQFVSFSKERLPSGPEIFWEALQTRIREAVPNQDALDDQTLLWWSQPSAAVLEKVTI